MTYAEAMRRYGSDKPDLRIALEFIDVAELVKNCEFKVFTDWANHEDGRVVALRVPGRRDARRASRSTTTPRTPPSTAPRAWRG